MSRTNPESQLIRAIIDNLLIRGIPAWRNNSRVVKMGNQLVRFSMKGASDVFGVIPPDGRFLAVEAKMPGRVATDDQERFIAAVNDAGGLAFVAWDVNDVIQRLEQAGALDQSEVIE